MLAGSLAAVLAVLLGCRGGGSLPAGRPRRARRGGQHGGRAGVPGPAGAGAGAEAAGSGSRARGAASPAAATAGTSRAATSGPGHSRPGHSRPGRSGPGRSGPGRSGPSAARRATSARSTARRSGTSCRSVAHIGDSTSVGLVSPLDLPDPAQRLAAQYRDVGVRHSLIDASGGRSMVEEMPGQVNGYDTARSMASAGFRGCWVIALGTNDTANVSVGSSVGRMGRIRELMSVAHGAPVLWVNVKTLDPSGPWSEANMQLWNDTLLQACHQYPNLRVFDWASVAQDGWFISDGIHYTSAGLRGPGAPDRPRAGPRLPAPGPQRQLRHPLSPGCPGGRSSAGCRRRFLAAGRPGPRRPVRPSFKAAVPRLSRPMPGHCASPVEGDGPIPCNYYV